MEAPPEASVTLTRWQSRTDTAAVSVAWPKQQAICDIANSHSPAIPPLLPSIHPSLHLSVHLANLSLPHPATHPPLFSNVFTNHCAASTQFISCPPQGAIHFPCYKKTRNKTKQKKKNQWESILIFFIWTERKSWAG